MQAPFSLAKLTYRPLPVYIRETAAAKALGYWAWLNIFYVALLTVIPNYGWVQGTIKIVMISSALNVMFIHLQTRAPLRIAAPYYVLLVLHVWLVFCTLHAAATMGLSRTFSIGGYFLLMYLVSFMQGAALASLDSRYRTWLIRLIIGLAVTSAVVGLLQFVRFGPALAIAGHYNDFQDITSYDAREGIRATGLAAWPEPFATQCLGAAALIGAPLLFRRLRWFESVGVLALLAISVMPQSRTLMPSILLVGLLFALLSVFRYRVLSVVQLALVAAAFSALFVLGGSRLAYLKETDLQNDSNLRFRQEVAWPQAYRILEQRPLLGIGAENGLAWGARFTPRTRWLEAASVDNGPLLIGAWSGYPGIFLFVAMMIAAYLSSARLALNRNAPRESRVIGGYCLVSLLVISNTMILNNGINNLWHLSLLSICAGTAIWAKPPIPVVERVEKGNG
jgi:hypothetical protein